MCVTEDVNNKNDMKLLSIPQKPLDTQETFTFTVLHRNHCLFPLYRYVIVRAVKALISEQQRTISHFEKNNISFPPSLVMQA